jgi:hypothetical protein
MQMLACMHIYMGHWQVGRCLVRTQLSTSLLNPSIWSICQLIDGLYDKFMCMSIVLWKKNEMVKLEDKEGTTNVLI